MFSLRAAAGEDLMIIFNCLVQTSCIMITLTAQSRQNKQLLTFLKTDTADDMSTGCDSQFAVSRRGEKAGVAANPVRHCQTL